MTYVSGAIIPVKTAKKAAYATAAEKVSALFKKHGALEAIDCWGEEVPDGKVTSFPMAVKLEAGETVVFSWITWPSKEAYETGMAAATQDPLMAEMDPSITGMDPQRMIFGGFEPLF